MMLRHLPLSLLALTLLSCAGGQTGSEGISVVACPSTPACCADEQCDELLASYLAPVRQREQPPRLVDAQCVSTACGSGNRCLCQIARGDEMSVSPVLLGSSACTLSSRSGTACLWPSPPPVCTPNSCDCAQACSHALELLIEDDTQAASAEIRAAKCVEGSCRFVFERDQQCYSGWPGAQALEVDCAQADDAEIASVPPAGGPSPNCPVSNCPVSLVPVDDDADAGLAQCLEREQEPMP